MAAILNVLSYFVWVVLALGILIFVHELGHFLAAKAFGMRVEKFSIGFPPKIWARQAGDTVYQIGATPLGGYVKIAGMIDESMDTSFTKRDPEPWEFRSKPVWQRIIVISAGVIFNLILAVFIFVGLKFTYGEDLIPVGKIDHVFVHDGSIAHGMGMRTGDRIVAVNEKPIAYYQDILSLESILVDRMTITVERDGNQLILTAPENLVTQLNREEGNLGIDALPSLVGGLMPDGPASRAGMQSGDRIVAINGVQIRFWEELTREVGGSEGQPLEVAWERPSTGGADRFEATINPVQIDGRYMIGIQTPTPEMLYEEFGVVHRNYGFGEALVGGIQDTWVNTVATVKGFKRIFSGQENVRESLGGPVMIAKYTKEAAERGPRDFWFIVSMLSITLAFLNILPIPALDGGHLVFLLYEGVTRREPSVRVRMVVQQIGLVLILGFMAFVIFNDLLRL